MWWYIWVEGNMDILIMTITLIVVAGLVLEVVRLKNRVNAAEEREGWNVEDLNSRLNHLDDLLEKNMYDQLNVNVHLAEDIAKLQKKYDSLVIMKAIRSLKPERKATKK